MKILVATENRGKFQEICHFLNIEGIKFTSQKDLGFRSQPEIGLSFVENALAKARFACRSSGLISLAEDSGLVVPALNGDPGIYSARLAGLKASDEENVAELLRRMKKLKDIERRAFFVCVMTLIRHEFDPLPIITTGKWEGTIIDSPMGEKGFGYDSIFFDQYTGKTAGQMDKEEKFSLSHRGNALKLMLERLKNF